jgi:hypothetical protein
LAANASVLTIEMATQVDLLVPNPVPCINVSVQTTNDAPIQNSLHHGDVTDVSATEPSPPVVSQKMCPLCLDWADDAASLSTEILPSPLPPRDFSDLRSSKSNPFSSLQHRSKNHTTRARQSYRRHSHFNFNSFNSPHYNSYKSSQPHFLLKTKRNYGSRDQSREGTGSNGSDEE